MIYLYTLSIQLDVMSIVRMLLSGKLLEVVVIHITLSQPECTLMRSLSNQLRSRRQLSE